MKTIKLLLLFILIKLDVAVSMSLNDLPDETLGTVLSFVPKKDSQNLMLVSSRFRDIYKKYNPSLHYAVVENDMQHFTKYLINEEIDSLVFVNGLTCFDLAIIYQRNEFIDFMRAQEIVKKNFKFLDAITQECISITFNAYYIPSKKTEVPPKKICLYRSPSILDHSGLSHVHNYIQRQIDELPKYTNADMVSEYIKMHDAFVEHISCAIDVITKESAPNSLDIKRLDVISLCNIDRLFNRIGIEGGLEHVLGGEKLLSTNDLIKILRAISVFLNHRVSVLKKHLS